MIRVFASPMQRSNVTRYPKKSIYEKVFYLLCFCVWKFIEQHAQFWHVAIIQWSICQKNGNGAMATRKRSDFTHSTNFTQKTMLHFVWVCVCVCDPHELHSLYVCECVSVCMSVVINRQDSFCAVSVALPLFCVLLLRSNCQQDSELYQISNVNCFDFKAVSIK